MTPTELAWRTYRETFKEGDEIVLEDDRGDFYFGKLKTRNDGVTVTRPGGKSFRFAWAEIVFIAQSGFPVKEIMGMDYEEAVKRCDEQSTDVIRSALLRLARKQRPKKTVKKERTTTTTSSIVRTSSYRRTRVGGVGFGCPYEAHDDLEVIALLNAGNNGDRYWGEDSEETLILRASNGAIMHSFDLAHIFFWPDVLPNGVTMGELLINPAYKQW